MPEDMILKVDLKAAENQPKHIQSYVSFFFKNSSIIFSELAPEEVNITEFNKLGEEIIEMLNTFGKR